MPPVFLVSCMSDHVRCVPERSPKHTMFCPATLRGLHAMLHPLETEMVSTSIFICNQEPVVLMGVVALVLTRLGAGE